MGTALLQGERDKKGNKTSQSQRQQIKFKNKLTIDIDSFNVCTDPGENTHLNSQNVIQDSKIRKNVSKFFNPNSERNLKEHENYGRTNQFQSHHLPQQHPIKKVKSKSSRLPPLL